jgi:hypothetical protein
MVPADRQGDGSASGRQVGWAHEDGTPDRKQFTQPPCVLREDLRPEDSVSLRAEVRTSLLGWAVASLSQLDEESLCFSRAKMMSWGGWIWCELWETRKTMSMLRF